MSNKNCPICGNENECMTGAGELNNCWCSNEEFPKGIFELVPVENRRKHCICKNCLNKFKEEQKR
ncbi:cysteine-rich CWC family protein [Neobacillus novalis]|uniref:Cysteine-rich CWC family protein n=1 Tax=Neobacillus novalis TaxID=220687 RepID=A0AA95MPR2_9BACI|nr:cysteine-rich CWC family protein [Neobacillus novalis]WHY85823.1 cysteine-rich CWC family protein [Neobacillus novalis]